MFSLRSLLTPLSEALITAGICNTAHTLITASATSTIEAKVKSTKHPPSLPEQVIDALISHVSAEITVPLSTTPFPFQSLTIQVLTTLPTLETRFRITVTGFVNTSCKPPPNPSTVDEVKAYVLWASSCALAGAFVDVGDPDYAEEVISEADDVNISGDNEKRGDNWTSGLRGWQLTHNPTVLRKSYKNEKDSKELGFKVTSVLREHCAVKIEVAYKFVNGQQLGDRKHGAMTHVWSSKTARDDASGRQSGEMQEQMQLNQFVERVGKWSQPPLDTTNGLGDDYEQTGFDWA
jgi:hypothetical protein